MFFYIERNGADDDNYFATQYGRLQSKRSCPSREETHCLQFNYMLDISISSGNTLTVEVLYENGINQTLWQVFGGNPTPWLHAQIPLQTTESFWVHFFLKILEAFTNIYSISVCVDFILLK